MNGNIKIRKERFCKPHAEFLHASAVHLEHVDNQVPGHFYSLISSILTTAFSLEAYLNLVGPQIEANWKTFDRRPVLKKLRHICTVTGVQLDCEAFKSIETLFSVRNALAHSRPERIVQTYDVHPNEFSEDFYSEPRPKHFDLVTSDTARQYLAKVREMIDLINKHLPQPDAFPLTIEGWSGRTE